MDIKWEKTWFLGGSAMGLIILLVDSSRVYLVCGFLSFDHSKVFSAKY